MVKYYFFIMALTLLNGVELWGDIGDRVKALEAEIAYHHKLYWELNEPEITDSEYDRLVRELQYWRTLEGRETVARKTTMGTLKKIHRGTELWGWVEEIKGDLEGEEVRFRMEPKIDGIALSLIYENGQLIQAMTKGSGLIGENVTEAIVRSGAIPLKLEADWLPDRIEIRGEFFVGKKAWNRVNQKLSKPYASPRHLAAGYVAMNNPADMYENCFQFAAYGLGSVDGLPFKTMRELMGALKSIGFQIPETDHYLQSDLELRAFDEDILNESAGSDIPTDGWVFKVESLSQQIRLGHTAEYPLWAIAYKFSGDRAETQLVDVQLQVGQSGVLTPVGILDPVVLGGTTIRRISLYNAKKIENEDLKIGDWVDVERAGRTIPVLRAILKERRTGAETKVNVAEIAKAQGYEVKFDEQKKRWVLASDHVDWQLVRLENFVEVMELTGLGEATLRRWNEIGLIIEWDDLLKIDHLKSDDLDLSERSFNRLKEEIKNLKTNRLGLWIQAWGIDGVGKVSAKAVGDEFGDIQTLITKSKIDQFSPQNITLKQWAMIKDWIRNNLEKLNRLNLTL